MFGVISFTVLERSFVEFSKSIGNSSSRRDDFTFLILYLGDELFFARLKSSSILWMSCCLFTLFLSLIHFLMHLLTSFSRCFFLFGCTSPLLDEASDFRVFS